MKEVLIKISKGATIPTAQYENRTVHYTGEIRTDEVIDQPEEYNKLEALLDQLIEREIKILKGENAPMKIYATQEEAEEARRFDAEAMISQAKSTSQLKEIGEAIKKVIARFKNDDNIAKLRACYEMKQDELKEAQA